MEEMTRVNTLERALEYVTNDRNLDNGDPEDNFSRIAYLWTFWLREKYGITFDITSTDVAMLSIMIKQARLLETETKHDNWIDIAGYAGCGAETASIEKEQKTFASRDGGTAYYDRDTGQVIRERDFDTHFGIDTELELTDKQKEIINERIHDQLNEIARNAEGR